MLMVCAYKTVVLYVIYHKHLSIKFKNELCILSSSKSLLVKNFCSISTDGVSVVQLLHLKLSAPSILSFGHTFNNLLLYLNSFHIVQLQKRNKGCTQNGYAMHIKSIAIFCYDQTLSLKLLAKIIYLFNNFQWF